MFCLCTYAPTFFQAFITLWTSRGFKETITIIWQFPGILLTPVFSFWVIGPISKLRCCVAERTETTTNSTNSCWGNKKIGVSYVHTWINVVLTLSCEFLVLNFFGFAFNLVEMISGISSFYFWTPFYILIGLCLSSLCIIQSGEYCLSKFVQNLTERTLLNFDNPFEIIHLCDQRMTMSEDNQPIPKVLSNLPSALA